MARKFDAQEDAQIIAGYAAGISPADIASSLGPGRSRKSVVDRAYVLRSNGLLHDAHGSYTATPHLPEGDDGKEGITRVGVEQREVITCRSRSIRTLEDLLAAADVDTDVWDVDHWVANKWDIGSLDDTKQPQVTELWQIKVWLKRKQPKLHQQVLEGLLRRIEQHAPRYGKPPKRVRGKHLLEISLFDAHFGKLAWAAETGGDYDLEIAAKVYRDAVEELLAMVSGFEVEQILYPVGQDFFHVNNVLNTTAHGTPQDVDGRLAKVIEAGQMAVINSIDYCLGTAPVEVVWVPGNHDPELSMFLARELKAWYRQCKQVTVDCAPTARKYRRYGTCLIGYTHGNEEAHRDLPTIMAGECPQEWSETTVREWHLGHLHRKRETRYSAGDTFGAVGVHVLPSLSGTDKWHYDKGYVKGRRAAEAYLWHRTRGYVGHFSASVRDDEVVRKG